MMIPMDQMSVGQLLGLWIVAAELFALTIWCMSETAGQKYGCGLVLLTVTTLAVEGMMVVWLGGLLAVKLYCGG